MSTPEMSAPKFGKAYLWPLLAPVILIVAYVSFYSHFLFCGEKDTATCSPISAETIVKAAKNAPDVAIYVAQASWTFAAGLYLLACVAALFTAGVVMNEIFSNSGIKSAWQSILIIMFVALDIALVMSVWASKDMSSPAQQLLRATVGQDVSAINKYSRLFDALSLTATLSLACAASAILFQRDPKLEKENLRRRQTLLRYLLYVGAALLAIAVMQLSARLGWGTSYLPAANGITPTVKSLVDGIVNSIGAFYALLMAAVYVPAALVLQSRVKQLAEREAPNDPGTWLTNNGFSLSFSQYLPRILALLGPFLAGSVGDLLIRTSKSISGTIL